ICHGCVEICMTLPPTTGLVTIISECFDKCDGDPDWVTYSEKRCKGAECKSLPVTLTAFVAERKNDVVQLRWVTATEINNTGFQIERATEKEWDSIGFVPSQAPDGNSSTALNYAYEDHVSSETTSQYRLKQLDKD